jgi:hypothetical protein
MPISQAHIATDRAARFLTQFCKHAAAMGSPRAHRFRMPARPAGRHGHGHVEVTAQWAESTGTVVFDPWGRAELEAGPDLLAIRLDAADPDAMARMQQIVGDDLDRFGRGQLRIQWQPADPDTDSAASTGPVEPERGQQ